MTDREQYTLKQRWQGRQAIAQRSWLPALRAVQY